MERGKITSRRFRFCYSGCELLRIFLISMLISAVYILAMIPVVFKENKLLWLLNLLCVFLAEAVVFWNGIIRLYISSVQIGIKWRVIGIMCGFIPIVNLIVLTKLMRLASNEVSFENEKIYITLNEGMKKSATQNIRFLWFMVSSFAISDILIIGGVFRKN